MTQTAATPTTSRGSMSGASSSTLRPSLRPRWESRRRDQSKADCCAEADCCAYCCKINSKMKLHVVLCNERKPWSFCLLLTLRHATKAVQAEEGGLCAAQGYLTKAVCLP
jgi:hypothetical protein